MRSEWRSKSSPVLTTTVSSPGARTCWSPSASFAPPTPPATQTTRIFPPHGGHDRWHKAYCREGGHVAGSTRARGRACSGRQLGQDLATEDVDPGRLIAPGVLQVDAVEAHFQEFLDLATVDLRIRRHQHPAGEVLRVHELGHLLEVLGRADVLLGELHAAVRPFSYCVGDRFRVGLSPGEVKLQDLRHRGRVLARLASTFCELAEDAFDLLLRGTHGDDSVGELAGSFRSDRTGRGHVDRGCLIRHRPQPARLHLEEAAVVFDLFPAEELADYLYRLEHAVDPLGGFGPVAREYVLVERFTGAETKPGSARI